MNSPTERRRLLLVGWDSADWKIIHPMIDRGELPALASIVNGGVSSDLATLEPQLSPMLWTSIASGKMAYHHGVAGFTEVEPTHGTVVPVSAASRKCKMLWEILGERGLKSHVVGWFATQGERDLNGCMVSNLFGHLPESKAGQSSADRPPPPPGTFWPESLAQELNELRVGTEEIDPEEILKWFVPRAAEVDQSVDRRLALLAERLAEAYSVQSAATWLMEERPDWDFMAIYFRAIDEISHLFMSFHPPRMDGVPERDFEIYRHVITITYRAHDLMLQRLLDLAGPETSVMVVSDHGFHSDHLRPRFTPNVPAGITVWHRAQGIFAAKGPEFHADILVHGARLLDLAPTILHWFGLPVGRDMEGRVIEEIFIRRRPVEAIESWEKTGKSPRHRNPLSAGESRALLDHFVKLGYIDESQANGDFAAMETRRENSWNMARACLYGGRYEEALPLLEDCHFEFPERSDHAQLLARCQVALGLLDEAEATSELALATAGARGAARLIQVYIALERNQKHRALELAEQVREEDPEAPMLLHYLTLAYVALRKWPQAEETARKILTADPSNIQGHLALARCFLHQHRLDEAVEAALDAIGGNYANSAGHFLLGAALLQRGEPEKAEHALHQAIRLGGQTELARAHRLLGAITMARGEIEASGTHQMKARLARKKSGGCDEALAELRRAIAMRAARRQTEREQRRRNFTLTKVFIPPTSKDFLIVSGLPRSGTSLMMQLLVAGGLEPMTDGLREPDSDNPQGYYEWEAVKSLPQNPAILDQAAGKAVKIISALLPFLPRRHRYRIIFMVRPIDQILRSQEAMIARRGGSGPVDGGAMGCSLREHEKATLEALRRMPNVELLEMPYLGLIGDRSIALRRLQDFLGDKFLQGPEVYRVIRADLHRNR